MGSIERAYARVTDQLGSYHSDQSIQQLCLQICEQYGLKSFAYFGVNFAHYDVSNPCLVVTYSHEWIARYRQQNYFRFDPALSCGFSTLLPTDWSRFDLREKRLKAFFAEAAEFGVGRNGMTFPIRGHGFERAVVTISSDIPEREWRLLSRCLRRDLMVIAYDVHEAIVTSSGLPTPVVRLAPRELECLKWKAAGKTISEIAIILSLSEKTVRSYLDAARIKLGATNLTHAVAKALRQDLMISPL